MNIFESIIEKTILNKNIPRRETITYSTSIS